MNYSKVTVLLTTVDHTNSFSGKHINRVKIKLPIEINIVDAKTMIVISSDDVAEPF